MINYIGKTVFSAITAPFFIGYGVVRASALTTVGVAATALSILTLGKSPFIDGYANLIFNASDITRNCYKILVVVNPYLNVSQDNDLGIITAKFTAQIYYKAFISATKGDSFWTKHVLSRGAFALGALAAIVTRTADLAIGIFALVIAVIPFLGRSQCVNNFAYKQLGALDLIHDICGSLRGIVNPQSICYGADL